MLRVNVDLENQADLDLVRARWKLAPGLVPGEPNEGLAARIKGSPARLADYDDSGWETCDDIQVGVSTGFTFGWYRITVTVPEKVGGTDIKGFRMFFETCIDDYGEIWVNGQCDLSKGAVGGFNVSQRVPIAADAQPGDKYVIACLAANGPLAAPGGGIFVRYARLAFENYALNVAGA